MSAHLSEEVKRRIEENKRKALAIKAAKQGSNNNLSNTSSNQNVGNPSTTFPKSSLQVRNNTSKPSNVSEKNTSIQPQQARNSTSIVNPQARNSSIINPNSLQTKNKTYGHNNYSNTGSKPFNTTSTYSSPSPGSKPLYGQYGTDKSKPASSRYCSHSDEAADKLVAAVTAPSPTKASSAAVKGKCVLLSSSRFEVDIGFQSGVLDVFKTINSRLYDPQTKKWSFDLVDYNSLMQKVSVLGGIVYLEPLPRTVITAFSSYINNKGGNQSSEESVKPDADLSHVDSVLVDALMAFQRQGVNFAVHNKGRVLIADDMGLGKTLQALCVAAYYRQEWPLLVVVPSSVRFTWREQILKWLPSVDPQEINVMVTGKDSGTSGLVNIMSYDLMVKVKRELYDKFFRIIIMDESHSLKNSKTARTQAAQPLLKRASRVILLSGTPALSRPSELFTQISAVDSTIFPKFHDFGVRYCDGKQNPWGWDFSGSSNLAELQLVLEKRVMIRRLKKDVLDELPSKCRQMVILDPSSVKVNKSMKASHNMVDKMKGNERRGALLEYFNATGTAKIKAIREYVLELLECGRKFLVFAHHQVVLNAIEEAVNSKKYESIRIDGRTSSEQRNILVTRFQKQEEVKIAILSITAANCGINLTAATVVVFAELFWNPGILMQAEDRAHRIGQKDSVTVHYLVAPSTADDYIWPLVQQKLEVLGRAGLSKDDFSEAHTKHRMDPKQKQILDFFEESFMDDDVSFGEVPESSVEEATSHSHTTTTDNTGQSNLFQYFKPGCSKEEESTNKTDCNKTASFETTNQTVNKTCDNTSDWLDDLNEEWEDDPDAPWPPKPKKTKLGYS